METCRQNNPALESLKRTQQIHSRTCSVSATGHNEIKRELQQHYLGLKPFKFHSLCLGFRFFIFNTVQEICTFF